MTHDKNCAFYKDGPCNCWMSRVSPCGAEVAETTTPEPEWLTSLRQDMRREVRDVAILTEVSDSEEIRMVADRATDLAASYLHQVHADLRNARTRIGELDSGVRALGGDPDRMVDPRDHEAAIKAMREEMLMAARMGAVDVVVAKSIAGEHMLRMAQATMGPESAEAAGAPRAVPSPETRCAHGVTELDAFHAERCSTPAPEVREVPAGDRKLDDLFSLNLSGTITGMYGNGAFSFRQPNGEAVYIPKELVALASIFRPANPLPPTPPLPDQPGAVIRCRISGLDGIRVAELESDGTWLAMGIDDAYWASDGIELIEVLYLPAGAGGDEGGKR